jgi:hypothetical protein
MNTIGDPNISSVLWHRVGIVFFVIMLGAVKMNLTDRVWMLCFSVASLAAITGTILSIRAKQKDSALVMIGRLLFAVGIATAIVLVIISFVKR